MRDPFGNTQGLKPNQLRRIRKLGQRRVRPWQLISPELARSLCELSVEIGRQLGLLIDRRGRVEWTVVGNDQRLYLPDIGRMRGGRSHFRGLRFIHTHLRGESLSRDDLSDLALLRLDWVAAILAGPDGLAGRVLTAHLLPEGAQSPWRLDEHAGPHALDFDFLEAVSELEAEFARKAERPAEVEAGGVRALLVDVAARAAYGEDNLAEMAELARTAGVQVAGSVLQVRPKPDPRYLVGRGKLEELVLEALQKRAELIVLGRNLSPAQARAIAELTELKVLDRTQLILDIFAGRAHSRDGKLQVELAQLKYRLPRLTAEDSGLSRLVGGIGGRGPGETKLEIDRRRARDRITRLEREIDRLARRRAVRRSQRQRNRLPVVALVGYTNAGKSTLLNQLTRSQVCVEDKLFATLDPTSRRLRFPRDRQVILIDTVGFIRDLPVDLVNAFRATLEEMAHADLLLHVVDVSDPRVDAKMEAVQDTLATLDLARAPRLLILNKCDRLTDGQGPAIARRTGGVLASALQRIGFGEILGQAEQLLWQQGAAPKGAIFSDSYP
ncbi:MAG: GTPase HflX [Deltaproteobacteria bacterium]|nr:GTPase HflX [Deltaproteobacteria bacterium]